MLQQLRKLVERVELSEAFHEPEDVEDCDVGVRHLQKTHTLITDTPTSVIAAQLHNTKSCNCIHLAAQEIVILQHFLDLFQHLRELLFTHRFRDGSLQEFRWL